MKRSYPEYMRIEKNGVVMDFSPEECRQLMIAAMDLISPRDFNIETGETPVIEGVRCLRDSSIAILTRLLSAFFEPESCNGLASEGLAELEHVARILREGKFPLDLQKSVDKIRAGITTRGRIEKVHTKREQEVAPPNEESGVCDDCGAIGPISYSESGCDYCADCSVSHAIGGW